MGGTLGSLTLASGIAGCLGGEDGSGDDGSGDDGSGDDGSSGDDDGSTPDGMPRGGTFNVGSDQDLATMVPYSGFTADYIVTEAMYDRLTTVDENFDVHPNLARDWESNEDATVWTFMLVEDATFANLDGESVTAADVVATYEHLTSEGVTPRETESYSTVEGVTAIDETTVEISLSQSDIQFPKRICNPGGTFYILPKTVLDDDPSMFEETDYGTGPFNLVEWEQQNRIRFEAKSPYHREGEDGEPLPYVDEYVWEIIKDPIQRANSMADGAIDAVQKIPKGVTSRFESSDVVVERPMGEQLPIVLDTEIEPLGDVRVRQAIKHALDRTEFQTAVEINSTLGNHSAVPPTHEFYNDDITVDEPYGVTAQPEQARELLSEAGFGSGFEVQTFYYDDGFPQKETIAQLFQEQMSNVGIEFDIQRLTEEEWLADFWNQDGEWYVTNYSTRVLAITVPSLTQHSDAPWNEPNWSNDDYDEAYEAATNATDAETLGENLREMQEINHEEGAWVQTFHPHWPGAHKDYVRNYDLYPTLAIDFLSDCALDR
jgi:peptide/nickel transport system substrate-binding protein